MAKIGNFTLPPELAEALIEQLEEIPELYLIQYGQECMPGGFTKLGPIRSRLATTIRSAAVLDPRFVILLRMCLDCRATVATLSPPALREMFEPLAILMVRPRLLLAMLVDEREEVQKIAAEHLHNPLVPFSEEEEDLAAEFLVDFVNDRFLAPAALPLASSEEEPRVARPPDDPTLRAKLGEIEQSLVAKQARELAQLRHTLENERRKHAEKLKDLQEKSFAESKRLRDEAQRLGAALQQAARIRQELEAQLQKLSENQAAEIKRAVQAQTDTVLRKWLAEPLELEQSVADVARAGGDLLARGESALEAQARQDLYTGNRRELKQRLKQLHDLRDRLATAAATAISPIREVQCVLDEVETEIARAEKKLTGAAADPFVAKLLVRINESAEWDEVRACSSLLDSLVAADLVSPADRRKLYDALQRKFSLLDEGPRRGTGEGDSGWSLRNAVYRNAKTLLLIDGHNMLFCLQDIFAPCYENGIPGRKARDHLSSVVQKLAANRLNVQAVIYFDGPIANRMQVSPNVEVRYSGGTGTDRADQMIADHLHLNSFEKLGQKAFVVSDDRDVRRQILRAGATYVPLDVFAVIAKDFRCLCIILLLLLTFSNSVSAQDKTNAPPTIEQTARDFYGSPPPPNAKPRN